MIGGQRNRIVEARCGRAPRGSRRGRGRARAAAGTSPARRCRRCGRHSRSPARPIEMMSGGRARRAACPGSAPPTERARRASACGRGAEPSQVARARANAPLPTGLPPPSIGIGLRLGGAERRRIERRRAAPRSPRRPRHWSAQRLAGMEPRKVRLELVAVQYQRWSATWPLIITAERSLPDNRDVAGSPATSLHQLAERRHAQMERRDFVVERGRARRAFVFRAIDHLVGARRPGLAQAFEMIPVRAGWSPVRIVEWPGQVSVVAWL